MRGSHHGHHGGFGMYGRESGYDLGMRRGEFLFLVLLKLREKPMHGYALIKEIGKSFQRPVSAGMIYPTLQELEDRGYAKSAEEEGKKVYSITQHGRDFLEQNSEIVQRLHAGIEYASVLGNYSFIGHLREIREMLVTNGEFMNEEKMSRIEDILQEARKKVAAVVFGQ